METILTPEQQVIASKLEQQLEIMRNLEGRSPEECKALADETLNQYAPVAEELGLSKIQRELEELSIMYGYPEDYADLKRLLQEAEKDCEPVFEAFKLPISALLKGQNIEFRFDYRMKSVYSVWHKIKKDHKFFNEIYDLFATRIIYKVPEHVKPLEQIGYANYTLKPQALPIDIFDPEILTCWRIYTAITAIYRVQPGRIKDWITTPKPSGYQALHLTCMGPYNKWIEIQIRSERMHQEAEHGTAAHWKYKKSKE